MRHLEDLMAKRNATIASLETAIASTTKVRHNPHTTKISSFLSFSKLHEEQQLDWEKREIELESLIDRLRDQQEELANAAAQVRRRHATHVHADEKNIINRVQLEKANDSLPDPTLPVANQLEHAVRKLKEHAQMIVKTKTESKRMREVLYIKRSSFKIETLVLVLA